MAVAVKQYRLDQYRVSDREVLGVLRDVLDDEGVATSEEVARQFWGRAMSKADSDAARQAVAAVSRRLSYMATALGVVSKTNPKGLAKWELTAEGEDVLTGKLRAAVERGLEEMDGPQAVAATLALGTHLQSGSRYGTMMVRAFRASYGKRL